MICLGGVNPVMANLSVVSPETMPKKSASAMYFIDGILIVNAILLHQVPVRAA